MESVRERIGHAICNFSELGSCITDHPILSWILGMVIAAIICIFGLHHGNLDEFLSIKEIVISIVFITCAGWIFTFFFILPFLLIYSVGYIILHPLKTVIHLFSFVLIVVVMPVVFTNSCGVDHDALNKSIKQFDELNDSIYSQQDKLQELASEISSLAEQIEEENYEDLCSQIIEKANEIELGLDLDCDHYEIGHSLFRLEELLDSVETD